MALTPIAVAVLGLLAERDMHPYEMLQVLTERQQDRFAKVSPGSIYHAIERLTGAEQAEVVGTDRDGNRPERTTYRITPAGRDALRARVEEMLTRPAPAYPPFLHALTEAHNLRGDEVAAAVRTHLADLHTDLEQQTDLIKRYEHAGTPETYWIAVAFRCEVVRSEIAWLETFLTRITEGDLAWPNH